MNFLAKIFGKGIKHNFVSSLDIFLTRFNKKHPQKSASQLYEINKFKRIDLLHDHVVEKQKEDFLL